MPVHDWTRVNPGTFHHFHAAWITAISNVLNRGLLPPAYYAMAEQVAGETGPDVLTLQVGEPGGSGPAYVEDDEGTAGGGVMTVAVTPPRVRFRASMELDEYVRKQNLLVIRHASDDSIVALVEILSHGNKAGRAPMNAFLDKAVSALWHGYHLLLIDLQPPTSRDPQGIHGAIWSELGDESYQAPADKPLTLVAYSAGVPKEAYIEPIAVGDVLPDMPLFLEPDTYVPAPLEATYMEAWRDVPRRWRNVIEPPLL